MLQPKRQNSILGGMVEKGGFFMVFFPPLLCPFLLISSPRKKNMDIFHVIYDENCLNQPSVNILWLSGKKLHSGRRTKKNDHKTE